jgi:hypothetical protein
MILKHIVVFFSAAFLDVLWTIYIKKVAQSKAFGAALVTIFIYYVGGIVTISYVENHWMLLTATSGATIATFFSTKYIK